MLTSRQHPALKELLKLSQRKHRLRQGLFLAEGLRLVADGIAAGWAPKTLVLSPSLMDERATAVVRSWDYPRLELAPDLMALVGDAKTSQGVAAVFARLETDLQAIEGDLVLVLSGLRDPGNVGTLLRTGAAAGISGLIATVGTADLCSPKVVRASMGGIFRVPWATEAAPGQVLDWARSGGWQLVALEPRGGASFHRFVYGPKLALVVGSETAGVAPEIAAVTQAVTIPMPGGQESLNAGVAAALVLYQALIARGL